jgi:hypothetical protein
MDFFTVNVLVWLAASAVVLWLLLRFIRQSASRRHPTRNRVSEHATAEPNNPFYSHIVGTTHGNRQQLLAECSVGERLMLIRQPDNPVDPNAILVCRDDGRQLGYLPGHLSPRLLRGGESLSDLVVEIRELTGGTPTRPTRGANLKIVRNMAKPVTNEQSDLTPGDVNE